MWKVREQKHSTRFAVEDEHFDKVTKFGFAHLGVGF